MNTVHGIYQGLIPYLDYEHADSDCNGMYIRPKLDYCIVLKCGGNSVIVNKIMLSSPDKIHFFDSHECIKTYCTNSIFEDRVHVETRPRYGLCKIININ